MAAGGVIAAPGILALTEMTQRLDVDYDNATYLAERWKRWKQPAYGPTVRTAERCAWWRAGRSTQEPLTGTVSVIRSVVAGWSMSCR